jgi:hypothetical protein
MDHHVFDRLTRLFSAPRSRRTAWRTLLGAALLGATTRDAAAAPTAPCDPGDQEYCITPKGRECCPGRCFVHTECPDEFFCCTGPEWITCGNDCCENTRDACSGVCTHPTPSEACKEAITGSYRRR